MAEKIRKRYKRQEKQVIICNLMVSLVFLFLYGWFYVMIYRQNTEPHMESTETNTDEVLYSIEEQMNQLRGFQELYRFAFTENSLEKDYGTMPIPGLKTTKTLLTCSDKEKIYYKDGIFQNSDKNKQNYFLNKNKGTYTSKYEIDICTSMTPQGICIAGKYLLISAYCHTNSHNSVIYVLNKNTHEYVKEIVINGRQHVGGLAYDKMHGIIWVSTNREDRATASGFSMRNLLEYDLQRMEMPISYTFEYDLHTLKRDSFMTYADGYLYVGHFSNDGDSVVQKFRIKKGGGLKTKPGIELGIYEEIAIPEAIFKIPEKTQGIAIYQDKVLLTRSYGLTKSELLVHNYSNVMKSSKHVVPVKEIVMPQKLQQIYIDGDNLYVLFESAAYAYRAQPMPKVDRVLKLGLDEVFQNDIIK